MGMAISTAPAWGWAERAAPLAAHAVSWWAVGAMTVVTFGTLLYRLLAERCRRKTLQATFRDAPGGTVVFQGKGPGGPPMWVWIGDDPRPEPPSVIIKMTASSEQLQPPRNRP